MPRPPRHRRPRQPARRPGKRNTRSFSWAALIVVALLVAALVALPTARHLGLTSFDPGGVGDAVRHLPGIRGLSPAAPPERSPNALPPCPEGRAWSPEAHSGEPHPEPPHDDVAALDAEELSDAATNTARREHGLPELPTDEALRAVARTHSQHMAERDFFSHDDPEGRSPSDRVHDGHRTLVGESGENIWMCRGCWDGDAGAAADLVVNSLKGWMHSPPHRANILRDSFTHAAVGIAQHGRDLWATQLFSSTRGQVFTRVPEALSVGDCLLLEVTPYPRSGTEPSAFDLTRLPNEEQAIDATPLGFNRVSVAPGRYRLRFHFPVSARRFEIVRGPSLIVR